MTLYGVDLSCTIFYDIEARDTDEAHKKAVSFAEAALNNHISRLGFKADYGGITFQDAVVYEVKDETPEE